jgi:drug/metabolite transporter (DMT)-like permease
MQRNSTTISLLAVIAGAIGISFAAIFAKKAMQEDVGAMASAFWRLVLAIPIFALIAMPALRQGLSKAGAGSLRWTPLLLLPALFFGLDLLTWHLAFKYTTAGMSTLLANVSVVFVGIGGWWLLKERLHWKWFAGAACAMAGIAGLAILAQPGTGASDPLLGNMLSLCTAVCYAAYLLSAKVLRKTTPASIVMLAVVVGAPVVLGIAVAVSGEQLMPGTDRAWLWLVLLAIVPQSLGQGLVIWGLRNLSASFSAVVLLIQPVATTIWGALFLNELLTTWDFGLGMLVLSGILLARLGTGGHTVPTESPCTKT